MEASANGGRHGECCDDIKGLIGIVSSFLGAWGFTYSLGATPLAFQKLHSPTKTAFDLSE